MALHAVQGSVGREAAWLVALLHFAFEVAEIPSTLLFVFPQRAVETMTDETCCDSSVMSDQAAQSVRYRKLSHWICGRLYRQDHMCLAHRPAA